MHAITEQELGNDRTKDIKYTILTEMSATQIFLKLHRTQGVLQCATEHITHSPPNIMAAHNNTLLTNYSINQHKEKITCKKLA